MALAAPVHGSLAKPAKGTFAKARRRSAALERRLMDLYKSKAKVRDGMRCLVPGCVVSGSGNLAAAHLKHAGMGGAFEGRSDSSACFVTTCHEHHNLGSRSLHSTHIVAKPQTDDGGDGAVDWFMRDTVPGELYYLGTSRPIPAYVRGR
jgi:hypothetical protein